MAGCGNAVFAPDVEDGIEEDTERITDRDVDVDCPGDMENGETHECEVTDSESEETITVDVEVDEEGGWDCRCGPLAQLALPDLPAAPTAPESPEQSAPGGGEEPCIIVLETGEELCGTSAYGVL
jgi:hypothetical protein